MGAFDGACRLSRLCRKSISHALCDTPVGCVIVNFEKGVKEGCVGNQLQKAAMRLKFMLGGERDTWLLIM